MIRLATAFDMSEIMTLISKVVKVMNSQGSQQWHEGYPAEADYAKDIKRGELFVLEENGVVLGICTISKRGHEEYHLIKWTQPYSAFTIKRLAIDPEYRGKGLANQFFKYAGKLAEQSGIATLNTDTFWNNTNAQALFKRNGFHYIQSRQDPQTMNTLHYFEKKL
ncbi:Acetyltransferase (GNAT) domain-containing protein [Amphibacillus marinus]|uniref:Acetyltransferase (GNAT) domain-containing protein n=1 Tax=Amphibacillus marinus TaxID=872970 RepID=A0A1H8JRP9_9BACI|nr:GNAT family N-acetyltransferase [Amphibacillus marinus]SEN82878.1 Acetyltransferase (GNAT) domain-containing protein [Amphibacillus marinus]